MSRCRLETASAMILEFLVVAARKIGWYSGCGEGGGSVDTTRELLAGGLDGNAGAPARRSSRACSRDDLSSCCALSAACRYALAVSWARPFERAGSDSHLARRCGAAPPLSRARGSHWPGAPAAQTRPSSERARTRGMGVVGRTSQASLPHRTSSRSPARTWCNNTSV